MASLNDSVMATAQVTNLTTTGTAQTFTDTSKTDARWQIYRVAVSQDTYLNFDGTTVSSSNGEYYPAGTVEYKKVPTGAIIGYIQVSTGGILSLSRMV